MALDRYDFSRIPKTSAFIKSAARYPHISGGYRASKTTGLCVKILQDSIKYPGSISAICRNTNVQLESTTRTTFFELLRTTADSAAKDRPDIIDYWNQSANYLRLKNGSEIRFVYLGGEAAIENIRGLTLTRVAIDQLEQVSREAWAVLDSRISDPKGPNYIASTSNPAGHNWMWKKWMVEKYGDKNWPLWVIATGENPYLPPDFVPSLLENHSPEWVNRFVYGSFDAYGGQVYEEWDLKYHVINDFEVPDWWKIGYGADFGIRNPTVFEGGAVDPQGNLIIYDEVTNVGQTAKFYCDILKDKDAAKRHEHRIWSKTLNRDLPIYGDPSIINKNIATGRNIQEEYYRYGVLIWEANRLMNNFRVERLRDFLRIDKTKPHPYRPGLMGCPKLFIMRRCRLLIEELPEIQWVPDRDLDSEQKSSSPQEKLRDKDDHAHDALIYLLTSHLVFKVPKEPHVDTVIEQERKIFERQAVARGGQDWADV